MTPQCDAAQRKVIPSQGGAGGRQTAKAAARSHLRPIESEHAAVSSQGGCEVADAPVPVSLAEWEFLRSGPGRVIEGLNAMECEDADRCTGLVVRLTPAYGDHAVQVFGVCDWHPPLGRM